MRPMPTAGTGSKETLWVAASGKARRTAAGVGARAGVGGGVSEVPGVTAKRCVVGTVLRLEAFGRRGARRTAGKGWRCIPDLREGVARSEQWPVRIHQIV